METDVFELELVQQKKSTKISVFWIEVESPTGDFVIGPDHAPLVSLLKDRGKMRYKQHGGTEVTIDTYGGIFKVADNKALALLE